VNLVRPLLLASTISALALTVRADEWAPNLTANAIWHSNATQANRSIDQLDSLQINADILASERYAFGKDDALLLSGHFGGDWWPRYNGLLSGSVGGRAEWRHQFGPSKLAPIIAVEGMADAVAAKETGRRGANLGGNVSVRKRLDDLTRVTLRHEVAWFDARYATFDRGSSESSVEIDRDLSSRSRLTLAGRFRDGDIVSYASGLRPDLEALAPHRLETNTFDRPMTAYRIDAKTWSGRVAFVHALDDSSALVLAYEIRQTDRSSFRITDHLMSIGLVHQY
jgi:hypothetical protein